MSDNTLTVTEVVNSVTITPVNNTVTVSDVGVQGPAGATGATGATGAAGLTLSLPFASGFYYRNPTNYTNGMPAAINRTQYFPFFVPSSTTFDRILIRTATNFSAGTNTVRLGIYASTGNAPSTLILDAGTVSATTVTTNYQITINQTLAAGIYFLASNNQSASSNNFYGYQQTVSLGFGIPMNVNNLQATAYFIENSITGAFANAGSVSMVDANGGAIPLLRAV